MEYRMEEEEEKEYNCFSITVRRDGEGGGLLGKCISCGEKPLSDSDSSLCCCFEFVSPIGKAAKRKEEAK